LEETGASEEPAASAERRNINWIEPPNSGDLQQEDDAEGEEPDEAAITPDDTMKFVGYFTTLRDHQHFVNPEANLQRIETTSRG
jgi:hypothetical protein